MKSSYIARKIDEEYRRKKAYELKRRVKCKQIDCNECMYSEICDNRKDIEK